MIPGYSNTIGMGEEVYSTNYVISNSLRFRSAASSYLNRSFGVNGTNSTQRTYSFWIKRGTLSTTLQLIGCYYNSGPVHELYIQSDQIVARTYYSATFQTITTNAVLRDPAAWYHIVYSIDTTQATAANRQTIYLNGVALSYTGTNVPQNSVLPDLTNGRSMNLMAQGGGVAVANYFDGYLAEVHIIDGQTLTANSFGESKPGGVWIPKTYVGTYGINGSYLKFSDGTNAGTLGKDYGISNTTSAYSLTETFDTYTGWTTGSISGTSGSSIGVSGGALVPTSYGTGASWHGPTATRTLPNLGDFDITFNNVVIGNVTNDIHYVSLNVGTPSSTSMFTFSFNDAWNDNDPLVTAQLTINGTSQQSTVMTSFTGDVRFVRVGNALTYYRGGSLIGTYACTTELVNSITIQFAQYTTYPVSTQSVDGVTISATSNSAMLNNWTPTNISVTAGVTYDWMSDTPTNNYAVLNSLRSGLYNPTISDASLKTTSGGTAGGYIAISSLGVNTGKWYFEATCTLNEGTYIYPIVGIGNITDVNSAPGSYAYEAGYWSNGQKYVNSTTSAYANSWTNNDVIGVAFDLSSAQRTVEFFKNGVSQGVINITTDLTVILTPKIGVQGTSEAVTLNFGQRPFSYSAPIGFKSLCTANLPITTVSNSKANFDGALWTGNGTSQNITGLQFSPGLFWPKKRGAVGSHALFDSVRGANQGLYSDLTAAEGTWSGQAFLSDGFTVDATYSGETNGNGITIVGWAWKANGEGVTNTAGTITSTVSANTTAGFSIVTWTANGSGSATVGHGLGVQPKVVLYKSRNAVGDWYWFTNVLGSTSDYLKLNATDLKTTSANSFNSTTFNSWVGGTGTWVAYVFAEVPGFSRFGSYTGNGSTDGPFIYCGFRPKYILIKSTAAARDWLIYDTIRNTYNVMAEGPLQANTNGTPYTGTYLNLDILSNGFKIRSLITNLNANTETHIFAAFAELPFGGSNVFPAMAR